MPVELLELKDSGCRYPVGENEYRHLFCGETRETLSPYCTHHFRVAYRGEYGGVIAARPPSWSCR